MSKNSLVSVVAGFGIGAGLGLLFAPRSGIRTRALIARKAKERADELKQRAAALRDSTVSMLERGEHEALRRKEALMRAVETGARTYRQAVG